MRQKRQHKQIHYMNNWNTKKRRKENETEAIFEEDFSKVIKDIKAQFQEGLKP